VLGTIGSLVADSSETTGLKWQAPAGSSGPAFQVIRDGNQTVTANTQTKVEFNVETYDTDNCFDPTTNYRFTPNKAGYYLMTLDLAAENTNGDVRCIGSIYKNGSINRRLYDVTGNYTLTHLNGSALIYLNGTTDYLEGYVFISGTSPMLTDNGTGLESFFSGVWIRS